MRVQPLFGRKVAVAMVTFVTLVRHLVVFAVVVKCVLLVNCVVAEHVMFPFKAFAAFATFESYFLVRVDILPLVGEAGLFWHRVVQLFSHLTNNLLLHLSGFGLGFSHSYCACDDASNDSEEVCQVLRIFNSCFLNRMPF